MSSQSHAAVGSRVRKLKLDGGREVKLPRHRVRRRRSLEAAFAALGPKESSAKTEIAVALKRIREQQTPQVLFDPEARGVGVVRLEVFLLKC